MKWTPRETKLLGTATDREIAKRIGRTQRAVETRRLDLGIPPATRRRKWTRAEVRLLGKIPDGVVAERLGLSRRQVISERQRRGIASAVGRGRPRKKPARRG